MSQHAKPIDPGPSAVLDFSDLTVTELGALTEAMREGQLLAQDAMPYNQGVWRELADLRMEVRTAFIIEFFNATR